MSVCKEVYLSIKVEFLKGQMVSHTFMFIQLKVSSIVSFLFCEVKMSFILCHNIDAKWQYIFPSCKCLHNTFHVYGALRHYTKCQGFTGYDSPFSFKI